MAYGKIFESMFTGSMVGAGAPVFAVWAYVIASAKPPGVVELNPKLIAVVLGESKESIEKAIEALCSPDPESRTKDHDGRRLIREGEYLYAVPTWEKYNQLRNEVERRASNRESQRRWREKRKADADVSKRNADVSSSEKASASASTSTCTSPYSEEESARGGEPPDFVVFWDAFDNKQDRKACLRIWVKMTEEARKAAIEAVPAYVAATPDGGIPARKHPKTWLNGDCWKNPPPKPFKANGAARKTAGQEHRDKFVPANLTEQQARDAVEGGWMSKEEGEVAIVQARANQARWEAEDKEYGTK